MRIKSRIYLSVLSIKKISQHVTYSDQRTFSHTEVDPSISFCLGTVMANILLLHTLLKSSLFSEDLDREPA